MKRLESPARPIAELASGSTETVAQARKQQSNVLKQLKRAAANGFVVASLKECTAKYCGAKWCRAVCAFGIRSHRLKAIPAAYQLLERHDGPLFEVRVSRAVWSKPYGELSKVSIGAAKKLMRHTLDRLYRTEIVAVGSLKMTVVPGTNSLWRLEVHQIVAGATSDELQLFSSRHSALENYLMIDAVSDLADTMCRVFRHDVHVWQHPSDTNEPTRPKGAARAEYYAWLLGMNRGALTIRYGCDRHFNKLKKEPRTIKPPKPKKPRPYPSWIEWNQFGSESREGRGLQKERSRGRL